MHPTTKTTLALAAALLLSGGAQAQDDPAGTMDANGDGTVSADEREGSARTTFEQMDADHDGNVTPTEMDSAHAAMDRSTTHGNAMSSEQKIKAVDSTGDGIVSTSEHDADATTTFKKTDTDGDGSLSRQEMDAAKSAATK